MKKMVKNTYKMMSILYWCDILNIAMLMHKVQIIIVIKKAMHEMPNRLITTMPWFLDVIGARYFNNAKIPMSTL